MNRSAAYDFLLMIRSNHWPISYCFREDDNIGRKSQNFPTPGIKRARREGSFGIL